MVRRLYAPGRPRRNGRTLEGSPAVDEVRQLYADSRLRAELPEIGEVFIDITNHREGGDVDG
jgi:hypothetical protein